MRLKIALSDAKKALYPATVMAMIINAAHILLSAICIDNYGYEDKT
jgi:hypothetical protein